MSKISDSAKWHLVPICDSEILLSSEDMMHDIIEKFQISPFLIGMYEGPTGPVVESTLLEEDSEKQ
jgi:hypothetical protein